MKYKMIDEKLKSINKHFKHPSYALEQVIHSHIQNGMLEEAIEAQQQFLHMERPSLATDKLRSLKNSFICSCTLFTRSAINAGVDPDDAFFLSDACIKNIETFNDCNKLEAYEKEMLTEFVMLVRRTRNSKYNYPVSAIVRYVYENTTKKLSVSMLADKFHISKDYLSKIFYKETGKHLTDFIVMQKISVSKNFLLYTDMNITDIAALFEFCNHGYYSKLFKQYNGVTPNEFRKNNQSKILISEI